MDFWFLADCEAEAGCFFCDGRGVAISLPSTPRTIAAVYEESGSDEEGNQKRGCSSAGRDDELSGEGTRRTCHLDARRASRCCVKWLSWDACRFITHGRVVDML